MMTFAAMTALSNSLESLSLYLESESRAICHADKNKQNERCGYQNVGQIL